MTDALEARRQAHEAHYAEKAAAFENLCPNVVGNPFIPHFPLPAQAFWLGGHLRDPEPIHHSLYGGAAGGGKSDALLMAAAQYAWSHKEFAGVLIRKTYQQLSQPGALMERAHGWWGKWNGVHWNGTDRIFTFPSGAKVKFAYHATKTDDNQFQGAEYQLVGWDELTHWDTDGPYRWLSSRIRRPAGSALPLRSLSASNPGSAGHAWVLRDFVGGHDLETGKKVKPRHHYTPARIQDNQHLDREAYIHTLQQLHPTVRAQLLEGDWSAREPGDYFRRDWFGPLLDPVKDAWPDHSKISVRWWDLAASEKADACHTAGVLMSRHISGVRAVEHCTSFKKTPGSRDDAIVTQAKLDGHRVTVGIEIEGGSGGIAQYLALEKRLKASGFRVSGAYPKAMSGPEELTMVRAPSSDNAKAARCDPVSSCLERGYQRRGEGPDTGGEWWGLDVGVPPWAEKDGIRLFVGPWTQAYLDVIEGFPGEGRMDEADATSGAWAYLEAHVFGQRVPVGSREVNRVAELQNLHPTERDGFVDDGKTKNGIWRPG